MPAFLLQPTVILGILLVLSLAGNGVLYRVHSADLQKIGGLTQATKEARADAVACSEGVRKLREAAAKHDKAVAEALRAAEVKARAADAKADVTLQERPLSGDACDSALALNQRKLKERNP